MNTLKGLIHITSIQIGFALFILFATPHLVYGQDYDGDGVTDASDNCPSTPNATQTDKDGDGVGDACETPSGTNSDSDDWPDKLDNCPSIKNNGQYDWDNDGIGDACDAECDYTQLAIKCFNGGAPQYGGSCDCECPTAWEGAQCDLICFVGCTTPAWEGDKDMDGVADGVDNAPYIPNSSQTDTDSDGVGDVSDNCIFTSNTSQTDTDGDGVGDACSSLVFPIVLQSYEASLQSDHILLSWSTAQEVNSHYFIIDKSSDGKEFTEWQRMEAAGYAQEKQDYEIADYDLDNLLFHHYRLRQVDYDGTIYIVGIVTIDTRHNKLILPSIETFPNPIQQTEELTLSIHDPFADKAKTYQVDIFDTKGRKVFSFTHPAKHASVQQFSIELPATLVPGLYFLNASNGFWRKHTSFVRL